MGKDASFLEVAANGVIGYGVISIGFGYMSEKWGWAFLVVAVAASAERISRALLKK